RKPGAIARSRRAQSGISDSSWPFLLFVVRNRVKRVVGRNVKNAVRGHGRSVKTSLAVDRRQYFHFAALLENRNLAVVRCDNNTVVNAIRGAPDTGFEVIFPKMASGGSVEALQVAILLGNVNQAVGNGGCAESRAEMVYPPFLWPWFDWAAKRPH